MNDDEKKDEEISEDELIEQSKSLTEEDIGSVDSPISLNEEKQTESSTDNGFSPVSDSELEDILSELGADTEDPIFEGIGTSSESIEQSNTTQSGGAESSSSTFEPVTDEELLEILNELGADAKDPVLESLGTPSNLNEVASNTNDDSKSITEDESIHINVEKNKVDPFEPDLELLSQIERATSNFIDNNDGDLNTLTEEEKLSKSKLILASFGKYATKKIAIFLIASIILIALVGGSAILILSTQDTLNLLYNGLSEPIVVTQNYTGSHNANFIFVSERRGTGVNSFFLNRMLIDHFETVFYFDSLINWQNYVVHLTDDQGNEYPLSLSHYNNINSNRLSFASISANTRGLVLSITNRTTYEEVVFPIEFSGTMIRLPVFYLSTSTQSNVADTNITITGGYFSTSRSSIFYQIENENTGFYFENIFLHSGALNLPMRGHQVFDVENNKILGRIDFEPLPAVSGTVSLVFSNAFISYNLNQNFSVQGLFANNVANQIRVPIGENTLVLERLGRMSSGFVLVLHGIGSDGIRQETRLDATLNITDIHGTAMYLSPNTFSGAMGTDILFYTTEPLGTHFTSVLLEIDTVYFGGENLNIEIDLNNTSTELSFMDDLVISESISLLEDMGYDRAEVITYTLNSFEFNGIFRAGNFNAVNTYNITAYRTETGWSYTAVPFSD